MPFVWPTRSKYLGSLSPFRLAFLVFFRVFFFFYLFFLKRFESKRKWETNVKPANETGEAECGHWPASRRPLCRLRSFVRVEPDPKMNDALIWSHADSQIIALREHISIRFRFIRVRCRKQRGRDTQLASTQTHFIFQFEAIWANCFGRLIRTNNIANRSNKERVDFSVIQTILLLCFTSFHQSV